MKKQDPNASIEELHLPRRRPWKRQQRAEGERSSALFWLLVGGAAIVTVLLVMSVAWWMAH